MTQSLRPLLPAVVAAALAGLLAAWLRADFVESEQLAPLCLEAAPPWWCGVRVVVETVGRSPALELAALAAAVSGYARRLGSLALAGLLAGVVAVAFGNALFAGPAGVLGLLALVRQHKG